MTEEVLVPLFVHHNHRKVRDPLFWTAPAARRSAWGAEEFRCRCRRLRRRTAPLAFPVPTGQSAAVRTFFRKARVIRLYRRTQGVIMNSRYKTILAASALLALAACGGG